MLIQNLYVSNSADLEDSYKFHMFSVCLVLKTVPVEIDFGSWVYIVSSCLALGLLVFSLCIFYVIFKTSHALIRPLRKLNTKMREVMMDDEQGLTSELKTGADSSQEISALYRSFGDLIQDK